MLRHLMYSPRQFFSPAFQKEEEESRAKTEKNLIYMNTQMRVHEHKTERNVNVRFIETHPAD